MVGDPNGVFPDLVAIGLLARLLALNCDQHRDWQCGGPTGEVHHLDPISRYGPSYDPRHLVAACHACNIGAIDRAANDRRPRFLDAEGRRRASRRSTPVQMVKSE